MRVPRTLGGWLYDIGSCDPPFSGTRLEHYQNVELLPAQLFDYHLLPHRASDCALISIIHLSSLWLQSTNHCQMGAPLANGGGVILFGSLVIVVCEPALLPPGGSDIIALYFSLSILNSTEKDRVY